MSPHCCHHESTESFEGASPRYRRVLWIVIALNAIMFAVEVVAGALAYSLALQADAMDFAADAATYGLTLAMIGRADRWRATAALVKGASLALMGSYVLGATLWRVFVLGTPEPVVMGTVAMAALAANVTAAMLLYRFRDGDANVRSVWLCSRNDAIGNVAVMLAAIGVFGTRTAWPDLAVAAVMAGLFLFSSASILRQSLGELRAAPRGHAVPAEKRPGVGSPHGEPFPHRAEPASRADECRGGGRPIPVLRIASRCRGRGKTCRGARERRHRRRALP